MQLSPAHWPAEQSAITAAWLSGVLSESLERIVEIESFSATRVGTGQVGECWRVLLQAHASSIDSVSTSDPSVPRSVIFKFAASDAASRAAGASQSCYVREVGFYRDLQRRVGLRTPHCYFAAIAENQVDHVLVLEDVAGATVGDQLLGCSLPQAAAALRELALLHGPVWGDASLLELEWLEQPTAELRQTVLGLFSSLAGGFLERFSGRLDSAAERVVSWMVDNVGRLVEQPTALTPVHNDYRIDNLLFGDGQSAPVVTVVDWQTVKLGCGPHDAAYFLGGSLGLDDRRQHERDLVGIYHATLLTAGVNDYDFDACWLDYRRGALGGMLMAVIAAMLVGPTARGDEMFLAMARRHSLHALDLDTMSVVV